MFEVVVDTKIKMQLHKNLSTPLCDPDCNISGYQMNYCTYVAVTDTG